MDAFDNKEDQVPNPYRGCQIGACFACGQGVETRLSPENRQQADDTNTLQWQSDRPNPLIIFPCPDEFYTPLLLPGMYLPVEFMAEKIEHSPFHALHDHEAAKCLAAFLDHEIDHRYMLIGIVPMVLRLLASRCYAQLALLTRRFRASRWENLLSQSNNIRDLFNAIAPLHEVVANLNNMVVKKTNPYAKLIGNGSLAKYMRVYGANFKNILHDFSYIIEHLGEWFAPSPIQSYTIYTLAEFIIMGAIDSREIRDDLLSHPSLIPAGHLFHHFAQVGLPYFEVHKKSSLRPHYLTFFTYTVHDIAGRLEEIKSGIQKAKLTRSKKPLKDDLEQLAYIAKAIPQFRKWLQRMDIHNWLKRRVLDGISEVQDWIRDTGFDLPLIEAWQTDLSPYISILIQNNATGVINRFHYGSQEEPILKNIGEQFGELYRPVLKEHMSDNALIFYNIQSDRTVGIWYAPNFEKSNKAPITPGLFIFRATNDEGTDFTDRIGNLIIFESLREQIVSGDGISCLLYHQNGGRCCGKAALMWSIYEAGLKAIEELHWPYSRWIEPECSKPSNR